MAITINIYYTGENWSAVSFAKEMISEGIVDKIRSTSGNLRYDYFLPIDDGQTILLIDSWENQAALDLHHASPMMKRITALREKYNLTMQVQRFVNEEEIPVSDLKYIKTQ